MLLSTATTGSEWVSIALLRGIARHALACAGGPVRTSALRCRVVDTGVGGLGTAGAVVASGLCTIAAYLAGSAWMRVRNGNGRELGSHHCKQATYTRARGFPWVVRG